jgi:hypothetical protein
MPDRQQPTLDTPPLIETPVIDIQDLEHKPGPETRVNTKGIDVKPDSRAPLMAELEKLEKHLEKEDEKARDAVAEFEEQYRKLPPG